MHGPYEPERGQRFNPAKLLIDPYAKAIEGPIDYERANTLPYVPDGSDDADLQLDDEDDAAAIPKSVVVDQSFDWEGDRPLRTPWQDTVIYETHVKGFTKLHPGVREDLRGTYAGLASDAAIEHLKSLGVTAVELLPDAPHRRRELPARARAHATTGATARSASSRRTRSTPRPARAASRCASSRGWSRRCTARASR